MNDESELITMKQLLQETGIKTRATIHKYMRDGMPRVKKFGKNYFNRTEVMKWLDRYRMGDPEYMNLYYKAQMKFPHQYIEQIEYIKKHGTAKHYMLVMAEVAQYIFSANIGARETDIIIKGAMLDYFFRGLLHALRQITGEENFIAISSRIEDLVLEVIRQGEWEKYKEIICDNYFEEETTKTMEELSAWIQRSKIFVDEKETNSTYWEGS